MATMSVGGLASGLDTNSIISQLTALEQAKVTREENKKKNAEDLLSKFKDLETRLGNLAQKANALDNPNDFNVFKALSNNDEYCTISGDEGGVAGQYEVVVHQLATTQKVASKSFNAVNTALNYDTTITLSTSEAAKKTDSTKKSVDVKIGAGDSLKDIVNKINAAEGSGVRASLMTMSNGDNRLVLTAVDTGTNGFTITDSTGSDFLSAGLGIVSDDSNNQKATSANALVTLNGTAATNETKFDELNTVLNKNNFAKNDVLGIYLPAEDGTGAAGWVTFELYNDDNSSKTIGDVLNEINTSLSNAGANFTASLNSSGEIVLEGNLNADQNFGSAQLKNVKIQMGNFDEDAANEDGSVGAFTDVKKDMGALASRNIFTNVINEGQNAFYTIDGMAVSSQSNNDSKTITGTTFTLKKADPNITVKVSLELDKSKLADNIKAFVEEFNSLIKFIDENSKSTVEEKTDETTGKKTSTRTVGAFTGDSNISMLRTNLRDMLTKTIDELTGNKNNGYSTAYSSLSRLGITTQKDGSLSVDGEKLDKALDADFEGIRRLFTTNSFSDTPGFSVGHFTKDSTTGIYEINPVTGEITVNGKTETASGFGGNYTSSNGISFETPGSGASAKVTFVRGIAAQISTFVEKAKSSVDGFFKKSEETYQKRIDEIQKRVDQLQGRVNNYTTRLTSQFAALERSMSNLQAQTANMMSVLNSGR